MIYLHADMSLKERALARIAPPTTTPGRYTAPDTVLAFLNSLGLSRATQPRPALTTQNGISSG
jgi:hypothetical protein